MRARSWGPTFSCVISVFLHERDAAGRGRRTASARFGVQYARTFVLERSRFTGCCSAKWLGNATLGESIA